MSFEEILAGEQFNCSLVVSFGTNPPVELGPVNNSRAEVSSIRNQVGFLVAVNPPKNVAQWTGTDMNGKAVTSPDGMDVMSAHLLNTESGKRYDVQDVRWHTNIMFEMLLKK